MVKIREEICGVKAGSQFGKWTVLGSAFRRGRLDWSFVVQCQCGEVAVTRFNDLAYGKSTGCKSCHARVSNYRHGGAPASGVERLYGIWTMMRQRCENEDNADYRWYGAKGIEVCDEWQDYATFRQWALSNGYANNLTIDREKGDGNYEPGNCQWITQSENTKKRNQVA